MQYYFKHERAAACEVGRFGKQWGDIIEASEAQSALQNVWKFKGAASIDGVAVFVPQTEQKVAVHVEEFCELDDHRRDRLRLGQLPFCDRRLTYLQLVGELLLTRSAVGA